MSSTYTARSFRTAAERAARAANPAPGLVLTWTRRPELVTWADGTPGWSGTVTLAAPGYRTRTMVATSTAAALTIR